MKVTIGDTRLLQSTSRDAGDSELPMRWRAELERAQWQARQRYSPQRAVPEGAAPVTRASVAGPVGAAALRSAALGVREEVAYGIAPMPAASRGSAMAPAGSMPQRTSAGEASTPTAGFGGASPAQGGDGATRLEPTAATRPGARLLDVTSWLPQSSQVCVQGQRVSVVLRDADLAPDDWPALREQLRARCEAAGLELADLTINGVPIEAVDARR